MIKVSIKRTEVETVIIAKTGIPGEKPFKFDSLSPRITEKSIRLILPMMIETERDKRARKAHRKLELAAIKEEKAAKLEGIEANGTEVNEEGTV
ncbi:hypothetical protein [Paenisporosarcina sp. NPDC076898]|uniref:hypothetical protein n=1 Tax=unclassified Paenisporosarcina TaxID=2642018 RepID=UPI003D00A754